MLPELKALEILKEYSGNNNQILYYKHIILQDDGKITRTQADYINKYHDKPSKIIKREVKIDVHFGEKLKEEKFLPYVPSTIFVEKLLAESEKAYHFIARIDELYPLEFMWVPKCYIIKNKPCNVEIDWSKYEIRMPYSHQKEAVEKLICNNKYILADEQGVGKAQPLYSKIATPNGWVAMGDIKINDEIFGSNGKIYNVTGVFPQGIRPIYRITFSDNSYVDCDESHIWSVRDSNRRIRKKDWINKTTKELLNSKLYYGNNERKLKWEIPTTEPVQFSEKQFYIHPYILGALLGDGCTVSKRVSISVPDNQIQITEEIVNRLPEGFKLYKNKYSTCPSYYFTRNTTVGKNQIKEEIRRLGINVKSRDKFIPLDYKLGSHQQRLELLQGLMDTDGSSLKNRITFHSYSLQLCKDVIELVQSLGGCATLRTYNRYKNNKNVIEYRVNVKINICPFKLKSKILQWKERTRYINRYIKNIEIIGEGEQQCISVSAPNKLYLTDNYVVTHNTTSAAIASIEINVDKVLIICPSTLKINWKRELEIYTNDSIYIVDGSKWEDGHKYYIINFDILKNFHKTEKRGKKADTTVEDNFKKHITDSQFDLVIVDEAHYLSNSSSARTKLVMDIVDKVKRVWLLTGTPITNRPINYYNLLKMIDAPIAQDWMVFVKRYCKGFQIKLKKKPGEDKAKKFWKVDGASNLDELRERTKPYIMRRLKDEVLDLPEKIITPIYLELKSKDYEDLLGEYFQWRETEGQDASLSIQITKLMNVRTLIAREKVPYTIEMVEQLIEDDKKVIVFTNFTDTLETIANHFGKSAVVLDGRMSTKQKQISVDKFQEDPKIKVFVSNLQAGGVGITLTEADAVIFNDLSFVPAHHAQAEDRAHRNGVKHCVSVFYLLFENTIEWIIYKMLSKKKEIIQTVMGDIEEDGEDMIQTILKELSFTGGDP